jgi:hypothetical protein
MSKDANVSHRPPEIDIKNLQERKLLEAELLSLDMQVRNFGRLRDRLSGAGKDADASYRTIQARRDQIAKKVRPEAGPPTVRDPRLPFDRLEEPLLALPIAPAKFISELGVFGFGTSGLVQVAPASEGINVVAHGRFPTSGEIKTVAGSFPGIVTFSGRLNVGPDQISQDQVDPTINFFWFHNWKYLIPFPPPTATSILTYRFDVRALANIFFAGLEATAMSFVSLGETANLTTGNDVVVNIDGGWPLMADLTQPTASYNGHLGSIHGQVTVQRSFRVPRGDVPGVAVVVGAVGALSMMTEVGFSFPGLGDSGISIGSQFPAGRVAYSYEPEIVVAPVEG